MIEVEVHTILRELLRNQPKIDRWPHYLTMARLVGRVIRINKSALIQTSLPSQWLSSKYRLSYLLPAFLCSTSVVIVVEQRIIDRLLTVEIPTIQQWTNTNKSVIQYKKLLHIPNNTVILITPEDWFNIRLHYPEQLTQITTIIDQADDLENWLQSHLTINLKTIDWYQLINNAPQHNYQELIHDRTILTKSLFDHPPNPYNCYSLTIEERQIIHKIFQENQHYLPQNWQQFSDRFYQENQLSFTTLNHQQGTFTLSITPINLNNYWQRIWHQQTIVLIGTSVDINTNANTFQHQLKLPELTTVKFGYDQHNEIINLYIPTWIPLPETPQFQPTFIKETNKLLNLLKQFTEFTVILIQDTPLKTQVAANLAANFGSKIQVENTHISMGDILICDWNFWLKNQEKLPIPQTIIIATLPIPSLEYPLVKAKVNDYKNHHQDWFKNYLFPENLKILQRSIVPLRLSGGRLAIFDNRINHRTYGKQVLTALSPMVRIHQPENWAQN